MYLDWNNNINRIEVPRQHICYCKLLHSIVSLFNNFNQSLHITSLPWTIRLIRFQPNERVWGKVSAASNNVESGCWIFQSWAFWAASLPRRVENLQWLSTHTAWMSDFVFKTYLHFLGRCRQTEFLTVKTLNFQGDPSNTSANTATLACVLES